MIISPPSESVNTIIKDFLDLLWPRIPGRGTAFGIIPGKDARTQWHSHINAEHITASAIAQAKFKDIYFPIALHRPSLAGKSRKTISAEFLPGLWLDVDCAPGDGDTSTDDKGKCRLTKQAALEYFDDLEVAPSLTIDSGRGLHLYWLTHEPIAITDENRIQVNAITRAWHRLWQDRIKRDIDPNIIIDPCHSLAQVLRLPGTLNHKTGGPYPVQLLSKGQRHDFQELASLANPTAEEINACADGAAGAHLHQPISLPQNLTLTRDDKKLIFSSDRLLRLWNNPFKGDRSKHDYAVAAELVKLRTTDHQAARILANVPGGKGHKRGTAYIRLTLNAAKQRTKRIQSTPDARPETFTKEQTLRLKEFLPNFMPDSKGNLMMSMSCFKIRRVYKCSKHGVRHTGGNIPCQRTAACYVCAAWEDQLVKDIMKEKRIKWPEKVLVLRVKDKHFWNSIKLKGTAYITATGPEGMVIITEVDHLYHYQKNFAKPQVTPAIDAINILRKTRMATAKTVHESVVNDDLGALKRIEHLIKPRARRMTSSKLGRAIFPWANAAIIDDTKTDIMAEKPEPPTHCNADDCKHTLDVKFQIKETNQELGVEKTPWPTSYKTIASIYRQTLTEFTNPDP